MQLNALYATLTQENQKNVEYCFQFDFGKYAIEPLQYIMSLRHELSKMTVITSRQKLSKQKNLVLNGHATSSLS